ncbi:MAG: transglutaminase domain-containing protein [Chitinophagaceae bacterium]|nr:transglutaminase domain-containing protein [Chitinophagaceae bacterium]MCW5928073.1 transglutaminase domain-containing protein [Chitinophagaceae bacterium]
MKKKKLTTAITGIMLSFCIPLQPYSHLSSIRKIPAWYDGNQNKKMAILKLVIGIFIITGCNTRFYKLIETDNPRFFPNIIFTAHEDISSPKFWVLREKYQLDTVISNEKDELKRILLLRNWIHKTIRIDDYGPYAGDESVESTLDNALKGSGYHCGYYSAVQTAILNAYGYVTRSILADTGIPVDYMVGGGHHALNEVWLNTYHKWFLTDAKYDYHFEKNGIPLSALEVREAYLKNKAADIELVKGVERKSVPGLPEYNIPTREQLARVYTWISWYKENDRYTRWPDNSDDIVLYQDEYTQTHTWLWDGKPLWAYNTTFLHWIDDKNKIGWTPNTISSNAVITGNKVKIDLISATPNLKTYQVMEKHGKEWKDIAATFESDLTEKRYEWTFRAVNTAGVSGKEHKIIIER